MLFVCICSKYVQRRNSLLKSLKSVLASVILTSISNGLCAFSCSLFMFITLVFSYLRRGSHLLLLRIWINLRLSLLFLRHPLASYSGMDFAVEKGGTVLLGLGLQLCTREYCKRN